jgi:hypothetical protein
MILTNTNIIFTKFIWKSIIQALHVLQHVYGLQLRALVTKILKKTSGESLSTQGKKLTTYCANALAEVLRCGACAYSAESSNSEWFCNFQQNSPIGQSFSRLGNFSPIAGCDAVFPDCQCSPLSRGNRRPSPI